MNSRFSTLGQQQSWLVLQEPHQPAVGSRTPLHTQESLFVQWDGGKWVVMTAWRR